MNCQTVKPASRQTGESASGRQLQTASCKLQAVFASIAKTGAATGIFPRDASAPAIEQAQDVFEQIGELAPWPRIVRTWFYLGDIDSWYEDFNNVRKECFERNRTSPPPASTAIGLDSAPFAIAAAALTANEGAAWHPVESPLQVPATSYNSLFSRAATMDGKLFVSGTAAISPGSSSVAHPGDFNAQMRLACKAAGAILESQGKTFGDVSRAIAYCKHAGDIPSARNYLESLGIAPGATLAIHADVCRKEWLFELECDAD